MVVAAGRRGAGLSVWADAAIEKAAKIASGAATRAICMMPLSVYALAIIAALDSFWQRYHLVLTLMIETLDGLRDADKIAATPGVSAVFVASSDLGNFAGYKAGDPDYQREINIARTSNASRDRAGTSTPRRAAISMPLCRCGEKGAGSLVEHARQAHRGSLGARLQQRAPGRGARGAATGG
jgi:hypothetical protein